MRIVIDRRVRLATLGGVSRIALPAAVAMILAGHAGPAEARFSVCNRTAHPASVALGFFDGEQWSSRGWWRIAGGGCEDILTEPLDARYYYLYAVHEEIGGAWDGNRSFCVAGGPFRIAGRENCLARNYDRKRFFEVDTGKAAEWTENLSD